MITSLYHRVCDLGIKAKLIAVAVPCLVTFTLIVSLVIIGRGERSIFISTEQQGVSIARSAAQLYTNARIYQELDMVDSSGMEEYLEYFMADMMRLDPRILRFAILDENAQVQAHSRLREYGKVYDTPEIVTLLGAQQEHVQRTVAEDGSEYLRIAIPLSIGSKNWGLCIVDFSLEEMLQSFVTLRIEVLVSAGIFGAILLFLVWKAGEYFIAPLHKLTMQMNDITRRGSIMTDAPTQPTRADELGQLQESFYWMLERLQEAQEQRRRNIEGLLQTEKLATVGRLASGVAHEINNPLGGVILCFQNLCAGDMDEKTRQQHIDVINSSLEKIRHTVSDLLRFSRPAPLVKQRTDIEDVLLRSQRLAEFNLKHASIVMLLDVAPSMPSVVLDASKLEQVILNLLLNASFELTHGKESLSSTTSPAILLRGSIIDDELCIVVADTGAGIPEKAREQIFAPFFTTKSEGQGTGLGLAVSQALIAQHGGTLTLSDEVPQYKNYVFSGAVFSIRIPLT